MTNIALGIIQNSNSHPQKSYKNKTLNCNFYESMSTCKFRWSLFTPKKYSIRWSCMTDEHRVPQWSPQTRKKSDRLLTAVQ